jgi:Tol biopolymer transport system component
MFALEMKIHIIYNQCIHTNGSMFGGVAVLEANDFAPFWAPDGNRIVFASDRSGSMGIWVLEVVDGKPKGSPQFISDNLNVMLPLGLTQDGSYYYTLPSKANDIYFADLDPETGKVVKPPTKAVQSSEGLNYAPAFSPDGKRLIYVSLRSGRPSQPLVIRHLETGEERELQPDLPLQLRGNAPRWFPDGHSISVIALAAYSAKKMRWGIHQIHVETGAVTHVVWDDGQGNLFRTPPVWSPDGSEIFFMRREPGYAYGFMVMVYDLDSKQERQLVFQMPAGWKGFSPGLALSPDGQQLAFTAIFDDRYSFGIVPSAGGETREVLRLPKSEKPPFPNGAWPAWTPDGRHLLFARRKDEATELWRIPVQGGEPENLGLTMKKIEYLSVRPDGHRIVFTGPGPRPGNEVWAIENFLPTSTAANP